MERIKPEFFEMATFCLSNHMRHNTHEGFFSAFAFPRLKFSFLHLEESPKTTRFERVAEQATDSA